MLKFYLTLIWNLHQFKKVLNYLHSRKHVDIQKKNQSFNLLHHYQHYSCLPLLMFQFAVWELIKWKILLLISFEKNILRKYSAIICKQTTAFLFCKYGIKVRGAAYMQVQAFWQIITLHIKTKSFTSNCWTSSLLTNITFTLSQ